MTQPETRRISLLGDCVHRRVGGQVFIVMPDSSMHILENQSAVTLWEALESNRPEGMTRAQMTKTLCTRFQVDKARAAGDVDSFVEHLIRLGVVGEEASKDLSNRAELR